jgi:hypothetical protein
MRTHDGAGRVDSTEDSRVVGDVYDTTATDEEEPDSCERRVQRCNLLGAKGLCEEHDYQEGLQEVELAHFR